MRHVFLACIAVFCCATLLFGTAKAALTDLQKNQINNAITTTKTVVETLSKFQGATKETTSKVAKVFNDLPLGKFASCLGAFGGFISLLLIFLPRGDSPELKYMKKQFAVVDQKLDIIASKIDDVHTLIGLETQRAQYIREERNILYGHRQLNNYMNDILKTKCSTLSDCLRKRLSIGHRFKKSFDIKRSMFMIFEGTYQKSAFGEPLFGLLTKHYKGDVGKLNKFANYVLRLGVKAQQVLLTYEKLTGSKHSIMTVVKEWLDGLYKVRSAKYKYEEEIYESAEKFIRDDVNKPKYQLQMSNNKHAVTTMRHDLSIKYAWLGWIVIAYKKDDYQYEAARGSFVNKPADENKRKRIIIAAAQAPGTYNHQRNAFANLINWKKSDFYFTNSARSITRFYNLLKETLINRGMWKSIRTLIILKDKDDRDIRIAYNDDHKSNFYAQNVRFGFCYGFGHSYCLTPKTLYIIAVFKPKQEINYGGCTKACTYGNGRCIAKPFAGKMICVCKPYYDGENCETRIKTDVAENVEKLFSTAAKIPDIVDVHFGIKDMGDKLGASLGNIQKAIVDLERAMQVSFDKISRHMDQKFQWANMITIYSRPLELLKQTVRMLRSLPKSGYSMKRLAESVLNPYHISYFMLKINTLIAGRNDEVHRHKPILLMVMEKYKHLACSVKYETIIRNVWQQINIQQLQGYMAWIQALTILDKPTDSVVDEYKRVVESQKEMLANKTCKMVIPNSVNGICKGDFCLYPGLTINLVCKQNHYLSGTKTPSCENLSKCLPCECNVEGSVSQQCDSKGTCRCKPKFYGQKCSNRHCEWGTWGSWTECSKICDNHSNSHRRRSKTFTKRGNGMTCSGVSLQSRNCFSGTCPRKCTTRYTGYHYHGYYDLRKYQQFKPYCHGNELMKGFRFETTKRELRVKMECCNNNNDVCRTRKTRTASTDYRGKAHYLDAQNVNCGRTSVMSGFNFVYDGKIHFKITCCDFIAHWRSQIKCYNVANGWTDDGGGQLFYLDRQNILCRTGYFLSTFVLSRTGHAGTRWRYQYRCCGVLF